MKKDHWVTCKINSYAMAVLFALGLLILLMAKVMVVYIVYVVVGMIVWIILGQLFARHSPKAIPIAYTFIGIVLLLMIISTIMNPSSLSFSSVIPYLIYIYLLQCVYKAQKQ